MIASHVECERVGETGSSYRVFWKHPALKYTFGSDLRTFHAREAKARGVLGVFNVGCYSTMLVAVTLAHILSRSAQRLPNVERVWELK